jgi:hypothetical protein
MTLFYVGFTQHLLHKIGFHFIIFAQSHSLLRYVTSSIQLHLSLSRPSYLMTVNGRENQKAKKICAYKDWTHRRGTSRDAIKGHRCTYHYS